MSDISTDLTWLGALLRASSARHRAVSANLANANTEGYQPVRVEFEDELRRLLATGGEAVRERVAALEPRTARDESGRPVQVEEEVLDLMKNQLAYDTYARVVSMKIGILKAAISSRGR